MHKSGEGSEKIQVGYFAGRAGGLFIAMDADVECNVRSGCSVFQRYLHD
jgi:hypothetical protein